MLSSAFSFGAAVSMLQVLPAAAFPNTARKSAPSRHGQLSGYGIEDITWQIATSSGIVNITGTLQQVIQSAEKNNITLNHPSIDVSLSTNKLRPEPRQLDFTQFAGVKCIQDINDSKVQAKVPYIKIGIEYLRTVSGKPANGPGPGNCGRVSCWGESAIYWCNDNAEAKELDSFSRIADGAQAVLDGCQPSYDVKLGFFWTMGTALMTDGWTVLVRQPWDGSCPGPEPARGTRQSSGIGEGN